MSSLSSSSSTSPFWKKIEDVETLYDPEAFLPVRGQKDPVKAEFLQKQMFHFCGAMDIITTLFWLFGTPPKRVLDLGCGRGSNTLPMAKKGSYVCGIDTDSDLLSKYRKSASDSGCESQNIRLRLADITKLDTFREYEKTFDLVVAIDTIPYLPPKSLRETMRKIKECMSKGAWFVGTIFLREETPPHILEMSTRLGSHFYEGGIPFVATLLQKSGFAVNHILFLSPGRISFSALKA